MGKYAGFIITYQVLLLLALPFYFYYTPPKAGMIVASVILLGLAEIGITAGYHRFYSHRTYGLSKIAEIPLLLFGTLAMQGSVFNWASNHRAHHRFTDTEKDPHSIKKGFWYAHMLWLFDKDVPIDKNAIHDLRQNKLLVWQHKHYTAATIGINMISFLFVGWLLKDFIGAFVLSWWTRLFVSHHFTWFINSLAHCWGAKTYSKEQTAVDNFLLALVTFGEGYHNYHHVFSSDYRNGVRWYHFDPSKWLVWTASKIRLAQNLKKISPYTAKRRLVEEDKRILLNKIKHGMIEKKEELEKKVIQISERLLARLSHINQLLQQYKEQREKRKILRAEIKQLKRSIRHDWREWLRLSDGIMSI